MARSSLWQANHGARFSGDAQNMVGNQVERAYRCTDLLDKRRALMDAWGSSASR